jgi:hypothetical protein
MNIGDEITISLPEVDGQGETLCQIALGKYGLTIHPEGTGVYDGDFSPILIEQWNGKIRLIYWSDINEQDPTIVDLSSALESNRKQPIGKCPDCGTTIPDDSMYDDYCICGRVFLEPRA